MVLWWGGGVQWSYYRVMCACCKLSMLQSGNGEKFNCFGKAPTSVNRRAKEVCLLGPPWLDLHSSGTGYMITEVSKQPRQNKTRLPSLVLSPLLINHRNKHTNRLSGTNAKTMRVQCKPENQMIYPACLQSN